jgi:hypothetical protein
MISLSEFKSLLGPLAETLSEDEILKLRDMEYQIADAFIEWWLTNRKTRDAKAGQYNIPDIEF